LRLGRAGVTYSRMVAGYTIRLSRRAEVRALPELERRAHERLVPDAGSAGQRAEPVPPPSTLDVLLSAHEDGRLWVAADDGGEVIGFALLTELGLFAHLAAIFVLPEHGRRGLGAALLEAACEWAGSRGFSAVTLSASRDVAWSAPFFARHGFELIPPSELPPELLRIVQGEQSLGLRTELRVIMQREV
jgi:4-diphosphocytidyl-2-C-methyl-D-erythritol kinase